MGLARALALALRMAARRRVRLTVAGCRPRRLPRSPHLPLRPPPPPRVPLAPPRVLPSWVQPPRPPVPRSTKRSLQVQPPPTPKPTPGTPQPRLVQMLHRVSQPSRTRGTSQRQQHPPHQSQPRTSPTPGTNPNHPQRMLHPVSQLQWHPLQPSQTRGTSPPRRHLPHRWQPRASPTRGTNPNHPQRMLHLVSQLRWHPLQQSPTRGTNLPRRHPPQPRASPTRGTNPNHPQRMLHLVSQLRWHPLQPSPTPGTSLCRTRMTNRSNLSRQVQQPRTRSPRQGSPGMQRCSTSPIPGTDRPHIRNNPAVAVMAGLFRCGGEIPPPREHLLRHHWNDGESVPTSRVRFAGAAAKKRRANPSAQRSSSRATQKFGGHAVVRGARCYCCVPPELLRWGWASALLTSALGLGVYVAGCLRCSRASASAPGG
jgi:hypothetical protein